MLLDAQVLAFIGVAAVLTITPGADTMLVLRSVLSYGRRAGIIATFGICSGLLVHAALSALGLSLILLRSATVFEIVKLAGAAYLIFLGAQSLWSARRGPHSAATDTPAAFSAHRSAWRAYGQGLMSNVLNPKVAIFYLAFLPQFIQPGDPLLAKSFFLAAIHLAMGLVWLSLVALLVGWMRAVFTRPAVRRRLEAVTGLILIGFGVRLAMERR